MKNQKEKKMRTKISMTKKVAIVFVLFLLILLAVFISQKNSNSLDTRRVEGFYVASDSPTKQALSLQYSSEKNETIKGGLVPHHTLAGEMIASFYSNLPQEIDTIVVVGPDHYNRSHNLALTSTINWKTDYGTLYGDDISGLSEHIKTENTFVPFEHSITSQIPFISYFYPDITVIPIVVSQTMSRSTLESLASDLSVLKSDGTIVVAAVDFSHYILHEEAVENSKEVLTFIKNNDTSRLLSLEDDYLDSPQSLVLLHTVLGESKFELFDKMTSADILNDYSKQVTGYITGYYHGDN